MIISRPVECCDVRILCISSRDLTSSPSYMLINDERVPVCSQLTLFTNIVNTCYVTETDILNYHKRNLITFVKLLNSCSMNIKSDSTRNTVYMFVLLTFMLGKFVGAQFIRFKWNFVLKYAFKLNWSQLLNDQTLFKGVQEKSYQFQLCETSQRQRSRIKNSVPGYRHCQMIQTK